MKKKDVEKSLNILGWFLKREGGSHEVWSNGEGKTEMLPRHREIDEILANKILKTAKKFPGKNSKSKE